MTLLTVEITFCLIRKQELYGTIKMVTAASRHCLLNRIVLEIMVRYLFVQQHTLSNCSCCCELSCMNIMPSLFPLIQGKKIAFFFFSKNDQGLPGSSLLCLHSFQPSLVKVESLWNCQLYSESWWLGLNWPVLFKSTFKISWNILFSYTTSCSVQHKQILQSGWRGKNKVSHPRM